jgi:two-component system OmpR family response regulator
VKALLRRAAVPPRDDDPQAPLRRGELTLDSQRCACTWRDDAVALTATELGLLRSLMGTPGRVYSRNELVDRAWGYGHHITERTVDSHIRRIRKKFTAVGADPIETVYGFGYRLRG